LYNPPPFSALFPLNELLLIVGEEEALYNPPPLVAAVFSLKELLVIVGEEYRLYNPPPSSL